MSTAVRRWQAFTDGTAHHAATDLSFEVMGRIRSTDVPLLPPPSDTARREH